MTDGKAKKYCVILGILLIFILAGCQRDKRKVLEDSALEKSEWQELPSSDIFSIELREPITTKSDKISVRLIKRDDSAAQEYYFHDDIYVEKQVDGAWYRYIWIYDPLETAVIVEEGENLDHEWEAPLSDTRLSAGKYRAVWEVYGEDGEEILASEEFEVKE